MQYICTYTTGARLKPMVDHQNHHVDDVQNVLLYNRRDIFCGITTNTYLDMDYHGFSHEIYYICAYIAG